MSRITAWEKKRKSMRRSVSQFYAVPRDPPSDSKLPIIDKRHTRNAMARFNQVDFKSKAEKKRAYGKIRAAARKFGIETDEFRDVKH